MIRELHSSADDFRVTGALDASLGAGRAVEIVDELAALAFLERFLGDPFNLTTLRDLAAEDPYAPQSLEDHEVLGLVAQRLVFRSLRIVKLPRPALGAIGEEAEELAPVRAEAPVPETTWIEFKIIDDRTNRPIPKIKLTVTLPDGGKAPHTTNDDGLITIDPISAGSCKIACDDDDLRLAKTLELTGVGDGIVDETQEEPEKLAGPLRVAYVEHHKVRKDESLDSLAKAVGKTWKDLARFNFGTDDPAKINGMLAAHVGCTKKTKDRKNYVFSDSDDPGILFIPRRWEQGGFSTGQTHVFRVRPIVRVSKPFIFSY